MKKSFFYALLMSVLVLNGCKDDDSPLFNPTEISKTYGTSDAFLNMTYGGAALNGKQVIFKTEDSRTATLTLMDVIPGQAQMVIEGILLVEKDGQYIFSGLQTMTRASSETIVEYSGAVKDTSLTLSLDVTLPDVLGIVKSYGLADLTKGTIEQWRYNMGKFTTTSVEDFVSGPCYMEMAVNLPPAGSTRKDTINAVMLHGMVMTPRRVLGCILPQVLKTVSLEKDGNICAEYSSDSIKFETGWVMSSSSITPELIASLTAGRTWQPQSPKNLAFWYVKENKLYVKLNVPAIIVQAMADEGQTEGNEMLLGLINNVLNGDAADLKKMLNTVSGMEGMEMLGALADLSDETFAMLLDWIKNGIPLEVKARNGQTCISLNRESLTPIVKDLPLLIPMVKEANPMGMGGMLANILQGITDSWQWATKVDLGLELVGR